METTKCSLNSGQTISPLRSWIQMLRLWAWSLTSTFISPFTLGGSIWPHTYEHQSLHYLLHFFKFFFAVLFFFFFNSWLFLPPICWLQIILLMCYPRNNHWVALKTLFFQLVWHFCYLEVILSSIDKIKIMIIHTKVAFT